MKRILLMFIFLMAHGALAQNELASSSSQSNDLTQMRQCSSFRDFKLAPVGSACVTSKSGKIVRIAEGIQDLESGLIINLDKFESGSILNLEKNGLIIMFEIINEVSHLEATNFCSQKGRRLPTIEEFIALDERGFDEAHITYMADKYLWSSSAYTSQGKEYALIFRGDKYAPVRSYWVVTGKDREGSAFCVSTSSSK